jgi:hypothetical protein
LKKLSKYLFMNDLDRYALVFNAKDASTRLISRLSWSVLEVDRSISSNTGSSFRCRIFDGKDIQQPQTLWYPKGYLSAPNVADGHNSLYEIVHARTIAFIHTVRSLLQL